MLKPANAKIEIISLYCKRISYIEDRLFYGMHIKPWQKILQSILAILQHSPGVAILNAVSDPVFLNSSPAFLTNMLNMASAVNSKLYYAML